MPNEGQGVMIIPLVHQCDPQPRYMSGGLFQLQCHANTCGPRAQDKHFLLVSSHRHLTLREVMPVLISVTLVYPDVNDNIRRLLTSYSMSLRGVRAQDKEFAEATVEH